jgi:hypothetical protein
MSLIFEALQRLEDERAGIGWPPPPEAVELPRRPKRRIASKWETPFKGPNDESLQSPAAQEPRPRAVGSPLRIGGCRPAALPGPVLAGSAKESPLEVPSEEQLALEELSAALPFVQRILPLLDANIVTTVSSLLTPHHQAPPAPPPPPPVDLAPIEGSLAELKTHHGELRDQVAEQNASVKRIEDRLEMVREAADRNTLEQQERIEELKGVGSKVNFVALVTLGLLAASVVTNIVFYLHALKFIP